MVKQWATFILSSHSHTECNNILAVSPLNASSLWDKNREEHTVLSSSRNTEPGPDFLRWTADSGDPNPWVEIELSERSSVTGKKINNSINIV